MWIRIRDPEFFIPSLRDGKIRIRDKRPGSATLFKYSSHIFKCRIHNKELYGYWKTFSSFDVDFITVLLQGF